MQNIIVSIAMKKNIVSVLIIKNGTIELRATEKIKDTEALESNYLGMIYSFVVSLRYVRKYIQGTKEDYNVCFEVSNSIFAKWVDTQYSKEAYQEQFMSALRLLHELPIRYTFSYSAKPKALVYAEEKYCKKEVVSSLDIDSYEG